MSSNRTNRLIDQARKKAVKYPRQYRAYLSGAAWSFVALAAIVVLYLCIQRTNWVHILLGVSVTISGVVFGVFLQELLSFLIVPDKDVLFPLRRNALFAEFHGALHEFSELINKDRRGLLDDPETQIWVLLSSPLLVDFGEIDRVISQENYRTKFERELHKIFSASQNFSRHLVCLSMEPSRLFGVSPWERFIKAFSGYVISDLPEFRDIQIAPNSAQADAFYQKVDALRRRITARVNDFCQNTYVKPHIQFASQGDLQWQVIVIKAPQRRFYKAVVGFYGEDFFRKYSRLGMMSEIRESVAENPDNQGFVSDEPDIVDWVISGLVEPYSQPGSPRLDFEYHHSNDVHKKISEILPAMEGLNQIRTIMDNLAQFESMELKYSHGPAKLMRTIEYPIYLPRVAETPSPRSLTYCQYLFHPLIAESSTWSSFNLRLPVGGYVLDMCTGIGVQALAAIDRGAAFIQAVDIDPIALLCAAENLRQMDSKPDLTVKVSLGTGYSIQPYDKFQSIFEKSLDDQLWGNALNTDRREELNQLFERNKEWIKEHYASKVQEHAFDLIILEPPFVEFSRTNSSPSHDSLFDPHFKLLRCLLCDSVKYLKHSEETNDDWLKPYVFQSFSSLESSEEFERFLEEKRLYRIFRKHCIERNSVRWYAYHLLPLVTVARTNTPKMPSLVSDADSESMREEV